AGMVHAATLLAILAVAAPLARFVPIPALSAVLVMVAYNMGEWKELRHVLHLPKSDVAVWLTTFALTVLVDLTVAVEIGMILAAMLFIRRVADTTSVEDATVDSSRAARSSVHNKEVPAGAAVYRARGPLLFGASEVLDAAIPSGTPPVVILKLRDVPAVDATGLHALEQLAQRLRAQGSTLILCDARPQPLKMIRRSRLREAVGRTNVCLTLHGALRRAALLLSDGPSADSRVPSGT
ncbi:MAG TPA: STAS domain-containing protein, partial [Armatimonadota bacterium]|nr:STAS domain-containing protein [Armatimonadota bacterium]